LVLQITNVGLIKFNVFIFFAHYFLGQKNSYLAFFFVEVSSVFTWGMMELLSPNRIFYFFPSFIVFGSISPTFYAQLLRQQSCASKVQTEKVSTKSCNLRTSKLRVERW
jgi:hypothetical protein